MCEDAETRGNFSRMGRGKLFPILAKSQDFKDAMCLNFVLVLSGMLTEEKSGLEKLLLVALDLQRTHAVKICLAFLD